ncbi:excisionase [Pseudoroseomonas oryzae]|uniref:Excisionase n=2 Tax=Teichococcus oryzae TaxID=1608942 RepID=A0A5B2T9V6_9PROT|nr:excisionase [Pseudoroseomonas oryzae]
MLGCGTTKGHDLINAGLLDARKLGEKTLITMESIRALAANLPRAKGAV